MGQAFAPVFGGISFPNLFPGLIDKSFRIRRSLFFLADATSWGWVYCPLLLRFHVPVLPGNTFTRVRY
jgi:hypothetical protein